MMTAPPPPTGAFPSDGVSPAAHFEFEGGTLDLFDSKSVGTLKQFAESLGTQLAPAVQAMVEKYKDSYIAVLRLSVPTTPEKAGNGNFISMKFEHADHFFYPTSLTSSYARPIPRLGYYVSTPLALHPTFEHATTAWTAQVNDRRWYGIGVPGGDDLRGSFKQVPTTQKIKDTLQNTARVIQPHLDFLKTISFVLLTLFILSLILFFQKVKRTKRFIIFAVILYLVGGVFFLSLQSFFTRRWRLGSAFLAIGVFLISLALFSFVK